MLLPTECLPRTMLNPKWRITSMPSRLTAAVSAALKRWMLPSRIGMTSITFAPAKSDCTLVGWKGVAKSERKRSSIRTYKRQSSVLMPVDRPVSTRCSRSRQLLRAGGGSRLKITVLSSATPEHWMLR